MNPSGLPQNIPATVPGHDPRSGQRFGYVTGERPVASDQGAQPGSYLVRDDSSGTIYSFDHTDIVTEGFRTVRSGERVRFLIDPAHPGKASYVIRLDLPDVEAYYP
jgi:hypothetical protein